ncbi:MAG: BREX system P-loop protein BrxC, partial [Ruminococcus flavefaciens]|nr:BREX system P-loop protein BrxC [Ruminococcus flavefaciens]
NDYIALNTQRHMKTSMKSLLDRFLKAPYGFVEADVQWLVTKLFKDGEIGMYVNNESVTLLSKSEEEIIRYLTRKEYNEKLMTEKRIKANEKQKKAVREVMKELFHVTSASDDDDAIMKSFLGYASNLKNELEKLEILYQTQPAYPGRQFAASGKKLMNEILQMKYANEFFSGIDGKKDDYLDFAEDYEPLKKFFTGEQKEIFDKALRLMKIYDDSKTFIVDDEIESVVSDIKDILRKSAPYGEIYKLPDMLERFVNLYGKLLNDMQEPVDVAINEARKRVLAELEGKQCKDKLRDKFVSLFGEIMDKASRCNNVATLQNIKIEADALKVRCLNEISAEEAKYVVVPPQQGQVAEETHYGEEAVKQPAPAPVKKKKTVSIKAINNEATWQIESEADVKRYVAELEKKLISSLEDNTIINVEF